MATNITQERLQDTVVVEAEVHSTLTENSCPKLNLKLLKLLDTISSCQEVLATEEHDKQ